MRQSQHTEPASPIKDAVGMNIPFVHTFRTSHHRYVYDVNTRRILRLSPVIWDFLQEADHPEVQGCTQGGNGYSASDNAMVRESIEATQRDKGLLLPLRPRRIELLLSRRDIARKLEAHRMQLILNVTENCNFRCGYCVYGGGYPKYRGHRARNMPRAVAMAAIDDFLEHSGQTPRPAIGFYGGEPLLNSTLIQDCVRHVTSRRRGKDCHLVITTNGSLLKGAAADFLASAGFSIRLSLDGPAGVHDRFRRTKEGLGTWSLITANIRRFLARHPSYRTNGKLSFHAVVAPSMDVQEVNAFFCGPDVLHDGMKVNLVQPSRTGERCQDCPASDGGSPPGWGAVYRAFVANAKSGAYARRPEAPAFRLQRGAFADAFIRFHQRTYLTPHLPQTLCPLSACVPGERRVFVNVDGDYFPCERVPETGDMKIGDVTRGINIDKVHAMLSDWVAASQDQCASCWCLSYCGVGCYSNVNRGARSSTETKLRACQAYRARMHNLLIQYCEILEYNPNAFDLGAPGDSKRDVSNVDCAGTTSHLTANSPAVVTPAVGANHPE